MTGLVVEEVLTRKRWITFFKTVKCTQFSIYHASGIENSFVSNDVIEAKVVFLSCPGLDTLVILRLQPRFAVYYLLFIHLKIK